MKLSNWLHSLFSNCSGQSRRQRARRQSDSPSSIESLETRLLLTTDFGDAPFPYATTLADDGPRHSVVFRLRLGSRLDGETDGQRDPMAAGDDIHSGQGDDEDGVLSPLDLAGTVGAAPSITLLATNNTAADATLAGWIDFNNNGAFVNVKERATITVPAGTTDGRFTLTFPKIPDGSAGTTFARFRLSSGLGFVADPSPTGFAVDGEVEDYRFTITEPSDGFIDDYDHIEIRDGRSGLPAGLLDDSDKFGSSVASLGDLDGDGFSDIAVGASYDENTGDREGAVYILFLNSDGSVKTNQKIGSGLGGLPAGSLDDLDFFGTDVDSVGDLDGDGITDLAVGALGDGPVNGPGGGAVYVLFMNSDGTVRTHQKITDGVGGLAAGTLVGGDRFGESVANLGDLDGDGVTDLAVGAIGDDNTNTFEGAVYVLLMNSDGTVKSQQKLGDGLGGLPGGLLDQSDSFGGAVASPGDLDGDGIVDLAVGAGSDENLLGSEGAVYMLMLNSDGTVKRHVKISGGIGGLPAGTLEATAGFGSSLAAAGDLDGDGVVDLAVGAERSIGGIYRKGALYLLMMNTDGTVKDHTKITDGQGGLLEGSLTGSDWFGSGVASLGDHNGDGVTDLVVGASDAAAGGSRRGAVWILNLGPEPTVVSSIAGRNPTTGYWWTARSDGNSFTSQAVQLWDPAVTWLDVHTADVNADGYDDLLGRDAASGNWWVGVSDTTGLFGHQHWGFWDPTVTWLDVQSADVNGDGYADVIGRQQSNGNWWAAISDGVGGFTNQLYGFWDPTVAWLDVKVADVNGDGNDDVVGRQQSNGNWWVGVSDGQGSFTNQLWGHWTPIPWGNVSIADVNGDGNDDVIGRQDSNGNWWVGLSDGVGSFTNQRWGTFIAIPWDDVSVADVNGDGNDDVVARQQSNGNWWVGLSDGVGSFTNQRWGYWDPSIAWEDVLFGDVDDDGDDDIIGREQSTGRWWVGRSDGAGAFSNELWGEWDPAVAWTDVGLLDDVLGL